MDEKSKRIWDIRLAVLTVLLSFLAIGAGVWQFLEQQRSNVILSSELQEDAAEIAFQREIYLIRLNAFSRTSNAIGQIITELDSDSISDAAFDSFLELYWGTLVLVESDRVEKRMIEFRREVLNLSTGWATNVDVKKSALALLNEIRLDLTLFDESNRRQPPPLK